MTFALKNVIEFLVTKYSLLRNNPGHDDKILQMPSWGCTSLKVVFFTAEICYAKILPVGLIKTEKQVNAIFAIFMFSCSKPV